jgi:hypothetical protein
LSENQYEPKGSYQTYNDENAKSALRTPSEPPNKHNNRPHQAKKQGGFQPVKMPMNLHFASHVN